VAIPPSKIRPKDLPPAVSVPIDAALIIDNGTAVLKATPEQIIDIGLPRATEEEAEAGTDNTALMTPLRTAQAIAALAPSPPVNTAKTLEQLKAFSVSQFVVLYDQAIFTWTEGDYTGQADDINIIQSDNVPLNEGAWVRQEVSKLAYRPPFASATTRSQANKNAESVSVKDFGAAGDNVTDDNAAIQTALDALIPSGGAPPIGYGGETCLPRGKYKIANTLEPYNFSRLRGAGRDATFIMGAAGVPVIQNQDPNALFSVHIADLSTVGGSHGLNVTGYTDTLTIRDVAFLNATTAGITIDGFFQTALLDNVRIAGSDFGITSNSGIANNIVLIRPDITGCNCALGLNGTEDFTVIGGRFEGGGGGAYAVLEIANARSLTFIGGYFEGGSATLLHATASQVHFLGTHFTWHSDNVPYLWNIDSNSRLTFRNCHSTVLMTVPAGSVVENCINIVAASEYAPSLVVDNAGINRASAVTANYWRESNGRARFRILVTLNASATGFLKVALPPSAPVIENGQAQASNTTTSTAYVSICNQGDNSVYVSNGGANIGALNDQILIEGTYRIAG